MLVKKNRCWQREEDEREANKGEVERKSENRKMNERVKELWETQTFQPGILRAQSLHVCVQDRVCVVRAQALR